MNSRRMVFVAAALIGAAASTSMAGCGGPEEDTGQPAAMTGANDKAPGSKTQQWSDGGVSVNYSESGSGYNISWSNLKDGGGLVYGRGWNPGDNTPVYYSGSYSNSCGGCFGVYGWTTNKLVEYYVCDSVGAFEGPHNSSRETKLEHRCAFVSDGDLYDVYYNLRENKPSIQGTATFPQYISVRRTPRTSGTITVKNHFDQWATTAWAEA